MDNMADTLWRAGRMPFPVQLSLRALRDGNEVKGGVLTFTDMTSTRAAEDSLRRAVQARDEVLAVVSHDLRNPVGTIFTTASLLLDMDIPPERTREHLVGVKRSAQRMNRLIQDLLDVTRLEAGAMALHSARFPLAELLDDVVSAHRRQAEDRGVELRVLPAPEGGEGWGDRDRVYQALANLVENGLKFTPEGGVVEVGVRYDGPHTDTVLRVSDSGPGIPAHDLDRMFDRFWQASRKDSRGAGLGLSIVRGIAEAHRGRVWVESEEGKGASFFFRLPAAPPEGDEAEADGDGGPAGEEGHAPEEAPEEGS